MLRGTVLIVTFVDITRISTLMEHNSPTSYYIVAAVMALLAIITATGCIDRLYCKKYAPGFKDGKFTLLKPINYNPKRLRPLMVTMLAIFAVLLLAVPLLGMAEQVLAIIILAIAVLFSVVAMTWAVEK